MQNMVDSNEANIAESLNPHPSNEVYVVNQLPSLQNYYVQQVEYSVPAESLKSNDVTKTEASGVSEALSRSSEESQAKKIPSGAHEYVNCVNSCAKQFPAKNWTK